MEERQMKKLLAVLLLILMMISLAACGAGGKDGAPGKDGINGADGKTPYIKDGNWWIGDIDTGVKAEGAVDDNVQGLDFYLKDDGTYAVAVGNAKYLSNISIPATYNGRSVTEIAYNGFSGAINLVSISIPDSVTTIGNSAFSSCSSLTSVEIGDSVTKIGSYAFEYCTSLTSVVMGDSVTEIGNSAFYGCEALKYNEYDNAYYLGNDNNPYIILVKAKSTDITSCNIHEDTKLIHSSAFHDCRSLTSVVIGDSVTEIGSYAFSGCDRLTIFTEWLAAPSGWSYDWNSSSCPVVWRCVDQGVTNDGIRWVESEDGVYIVGYIGSETDVIIPDTINGVDVINICEYAFYSNDNITSVVIPDSVTTIGDYAFRDCTSLTSVVIGGSVTTIGYFAFYYCTSLTSVVIPDSVTTIGSYAFEYCTSLTSVVIGDSVTTIGYSAFNDCRSLTSIKYRGTEEEWNAITKDYRWDYYTGSYTITYNYDGE